MSDSSAGLPCSGPCRAADVLLNLLDRLCPPGPQTDPARSALTSLAPDSSDAQLRSALQAASAAIVAATSDLRDQLQALGTTLEAVSVELAGALTEIERAIHQTDAGLEKRRSLEEAIQAELQGLELVAGEVDDVASLQRALSTTMSSVLGHLREHSSEQHAQEKVVLDGLAGFQAHAKAMAARLKEQGGAAAIAAGQQLVDPVTACPNRLAYTKRSAVEWASWRTGGRPLTLAVFGLDRLVEINERFGHAGGDQVLRIVAKLAVNQTPSEGLLCRHGGGEFVALLPGSDLRAAFAYAEKVRSAISTFRFHNKGEPVPVTVSSGISEFRPGDAEEDPFERAHAALRQARSRSGNLCLTDEDA